MIVLKMSKSTWAWAAMGAAGVAALTWAFAPRPIQVEVAEIRQGRFEQSIEEDGQTRIKDRYTVSAPVAARLARSTLREGDTVAAGDIVAVLTPVMSSMIDDRTAREAVARLRAATAGIERATARVERTKVAVQEARLDLERTERLAGDGFVSVSRLDAARLSLAAAQRELQTAGAEREVAVQERSQAAAALQPAASGASGRPLAVRSPVSGVVLKMPLQSEATITPGTPLLDIGDLAQMEVMAELLTTDAVQVQPGTPTVIERWGGPPLAGRVRLVEPAAFTKISALGIEEQRVKVLIDIAEAPQARRSLGDGFRVGVRIVTSSVEQAQLIPAGALFPHDGGFAVYLMHGSRARLQPVELGGRNGTSAWARKGVTVGERVILYPPPALADNKRVQVRAS
jgi:HlyD family secretion protein